MTLYSQLYEHYLRLLKGTIIKWNNFLFLDRTSILYYNDKMLSLIKINMNIRLTYEKNNMNNYKFSIYYPSLYIYFCIQHFTIIIQNQISQQWDILWNFQSKNVQVIELISLLLFLFGVDVALNKIEIDLMKINC